MELLRRNYQELKEEEEEECTFKPQIYSKNQALDHEIEGQKISVVERTRMWAENRQKKLEMMKEQIVDKDIDECTFRPQIRKETGDINRQSQQHSNNMSKRQQSIESKPDHPSEDRSISVAMKNA